MGLHSKLFENDSRLKACAVSNPAHVTRGAVGPHVAKIQMALIRLDGALIDREELKASRYGNSTADAVLKYKQERAIVNRTYQAQADNIVGIMTIARMDSEMVIFEKKHDFLIRLEASTCPVKRSA